MRMPLAHSEAGGSKVEIHNYQMEQHKKQTVPLHLSICVYVLLYVDLVLVKVNHLLYALEVPLDIGLLRDYSVTKDFWGVLLFLLLFLHTEVGIFY